MLTESSIAIVDSIEQDGFALVQGVVDHLQLDQLITAIEVVRGERKSAGVRNLLTRCEFVRSFAYTAPLLHLAKTILGDAARPVRGILFDKTPDSNWYVTWHQDLAIPVIARADVAGFGPWSVKDDVPHVQPPVEVLERMVSLRLHLDDCLAENGPIKFIAGSHKSGILQTEAIARWKDEGAAEYCPALRGDVIAVRPLVLHSSSVAMSPEHRRVIHIEYAGIDLPDPLKWAEA